MSLADADRRMRGIVATIPDRARTYLLEVLTADEGTRALEIGTLYQLQVAPSTAELLIDAEADPVLRAVLVGMLREAGR